MKAEVTALKEKRPDLADRVDHLIFEAELNGWRVVQVDLKTYMLGFKKDLGKYDRINVYVTKSTFVTQLRHPIKGKGQLFRRNIWPENYGKLFKNPRAHTGRGYYRRSERR
jgi:hypothetical protein